MKDVDSFRSQPSFACNSIPFLTSSDNLRDFTSASLSSFLVKWVPWQYLSPNIVKKIKWVNTGSSCFLAYRENPINVNYTIYYCYYSRKTESLHSIAKLLNILDLQNQLSVLWSYNAIPNFRIRPQRKRSCIHRNLVITPVFGHEFQGSNSLLGNNKLGRTMK